ncbi:hypothetical protein [Streptomyces fildesensis]|uniref:hypothetical protein n=1 Tax=Streptomyces fildesensis TaxID=375757 RepID=UPI0018E05660|nr:hypothetical protein [Streptomyces fildesensis]
MPLIEFVGYSQGEAMERVEKYSQLFKELDFANDYIFVIDQGSKVIGLNGIEQPLVRVRSRFPERNEITQKILAKYEDVEMLTITFQQREAE